MIGATLLLGAGLLAISLIDVRTYRIPDWLSLPLAAAGLLRAAWIDPSVLVDHLIGTTLGYVTLAVFGNVYFRARGREGLGLGDAKLFAAGGAWLGWQLLPLVLAVASVGGLIYALATGRTGPKDRLAFGPWLSLAIWLVWIATL